MYNRTCGAIAFPLWFERAAHVSKRLERGIFDPLFQTVRGHRDSGYGEREQQIFALAEKYVLRFDALSEPIIGTSIGSRASTMPIDSSSQQFMKSLVATQPRLFAYVTTLLRDTERAHDVLQKANVVMIEKMDEFKALNQEFEPWALKVCYYEVLADRRDRARDKHTYNDSVLDSLASDAAARGSRFDARQCALAGCLDKLPSQQRKLIEGRYAPGGSVEALANELKRPAASISQTLYRIREALLTCVQRRLSAEGLE